LSLDLSGEHGQAWFLDDGYSALGGFAGGATSDGRGAAFLGVTLAQNARADFVFGLQSQSVPGGSVRQFLEQAEVFVLRQRPGRVPFFWSVGQSFALHLPFGEDSYSGADLFGVFSSLSRIVPLGGRTTLRPAVDWCEKSSAPRRKPS
jgi:hypothetical protein